MPRLARSPAPLAPSAPQTFSQHADRDRLTPVAIEAYRALSDKWTLSNQEAAALIGVSGSTWDRIKRDGWEGSTLNQDQLTRVSALVGIFKGLHLLFAGGMADAWPKLSNTGPLFARRTPIEAMIDGGIPHMIEVRRYIDAVRGGL